MEENSQNSGYIVDDKNLIGSDAAAYMQQQLQFNQSIKDNASSLSGGLSFAKTNNDPKLSTSSVSNSTLIKLRQRNARNFNSPQKKGAKKRGTFTSAKHGQAGHNKLNNTTQFGHNTLEMTNVALPSSVIKEVSYGVDDERLPSHESLPPPRKQQRA